MNVESLRLMIGGYNCNAKCPFCITKIMGIKNYESKMNWKRFNIACNYSKQGGAKSVIISSLGEPTLYPLEINEVLTKLKPYNFPLIELQTNGYSISKENYNNYLNKWINDGLTTILLSIISPNSEINSKIMNVPYYDIKKNIKKIHNLGFSVRLSCVMFKKGINSIESLENLINFAKQNRVEQLTVRPVARPDKLRNQNQAFDWVIKNELTQQTKKEIFEYFELKGSRILKLPLGSIVYDIKGQNVALIEATKVNPEKDEVIQLSLLENGKINYNKRYRGAILL
jgi:molybdenum cofactor biosynthesis enzyme MoaA